MGLTSHMGEDSGVVNAIAIWTSPANSQVTNPAIVTNWQARCIEDRQIRENPKVK